MRSQLKGVAVSLALLVATAFEIQAQENRSVELGVYGRWATYANALGVDDGLGFGGRLGIPLGQRWGLEGDLSYVLAERTVNGDRVRNSPLRGRLTYDIPTSATNKWILGAGVTNDRLYPANASNRSSVGPGAMLAWRHAFNNVVGFRIEGTYDHFIATDDRFDSEKGPIFGVDVGLSFNLRPVPGDSDRDGVRDDVDGCRATPVGDRVDARGCSLPKDADGDGVLDNVDGCPNTPSGDRVDARGCTVPRDSDGDGVVDNADACPNTPAGERVDARGCTVPRDTDGDGVLDTADACPNSPRGDPVDARGCPRDTDGDGVLDAADACPNSPRGNPVDARGCPRDTDGDGVVDANDRCPNSPAGSSVDAVGCPPLFAAAPPGRPATIVLEGVNFATGSAALLEASKVVLDRVAESLVANPTIRVEVQGHTDNSGAAAANRRLSQARAVTVRDYFISKGVAADRLTAVGYGSTQPKVPNTSAANRAMNRRVELKQLQ